MDEKRRETADPYEADSDKEYTALEADRIESGERVEESSIATRETLDDAPEQAFPGREETEERERELREMLRNSVNRDPEALAADQSRRRSDDPKGDLPPGAKRLFERTSEIRADDLDMEDLAD